MHQRRADVFTTRRLYSVDTYTWGGSTYDHVTAVQPAVSFPAPSDGTDPALWLAGLSRTGYVGGAPVTLPDVLFDRVQLQNRADALSMDMFRVGKVTTELGGTLAVSYGQPAPCGNLAVETDLNTQDCYPAWSNGADGSPSGFAWFNKYLVTQTVAADPVATSPSVTTGYSYHGSPAWHFEDARNVSTAVQTWDDWRGYGDVTVTTGSGSDASVTRSLLFRGMDGDHLANGGTRSVSVAASTGTSYPTARRWPAGCWRPGSWTPPAPSTPGSSPPTRSATRRPGRTTRSSRGDPFYEELLSGQLGRNGLTSAGYDFP